MVQWTGPPSKSPLGVGSHQDSASQRGSAETLQRLRSLSASGFHVRRLKNSLDMQLNMSPKPINLRKTKHISLVLVSPVGDCPVLLCVSDLQTDFCCLPCCRIDVSLIGSLILYQPDNPCDIFGPKELMFSQCKHDPRELSINPIPI